MITDILTGRKFWPMVWRYALLPLGLFILTLPALVLFPPANGDDYEFSIFSTLYLITFMMIFFSWVGWGRAFRKFEQKDIPVKSFYEYPVLSGFTLAPVYWILLLDTKTSTAEISSEPLVLALIFATLFGIVVGPFIAIVTASFWRYVPHWTELRKLKSTRNR